MDQLSLAAADQVRYVALGDSFTEGVGDSAEDSPPGWSGRLAALMARESATGIAYANLAIRGRLLPQIVEEQIPAALALDPPATLVSICAGGNNLLRRSFDPTVLLRALDPAIATVTSTGAQVFLLSPPDPSAHLPLGAVIHHRGEKWAASLETFCRERGIVYVDVSRASYLRAARYWSSDRLHVNERGHDLVAHLALATLRGDVPPPRPAAIPDARRQLREEVTYYRTHVAPWLGRRLTGRSSGDGRAATYPNWTTIH